MNKKIFCLSLIFLVMIISGCTKDEQSNASGLIKNEQNNAKDIPGWNNTRWGMTEDEIKEIFKDKIVKLENIQHYANDKEYASIGLKDVEIIGGKFNVFFVMDQDTKKLVKVLIRPAEQICVVIMFKLLEMELMKKYGPPFYKDTTSESDNVELIAMWNFPSTQIQIYYNDNKRINFQTCNTVYMQNKKVTDNL